MAQMIGVTEEALREKLAEIMDSPKLGEAIAQANAAMAAQAATVGEEIRFDPAAQVAEPAEESAEESAVETRNWFRTGEEPIVERPEQKEPLRDWGDIVDDGGREGCIPAPKSSILTEADSIMNGERAQDYGENSLPRVAQYWSTYLGKDVTGRDVANLMILLKVAREGHAVKRDNHVDIAGYVALADQLEPRRVVTGTPGWGTAA
jgi:hypothetical protein